MCLARGQAQLVEVLAERDTLFALEELRKIVRRKTGYGAATWTRFNRFGPGARG